MLPIFQRACLVDRMEEHPREVQDALMGVFDYYSELVEAEKQAMFDMQMKMAEAGVKPGGGGAQAQ
jgi:hypothetical protein